MSVGTLIKERRKQLGYTLEQIGDIVGVGKSTVRKWENGMIENMGRDKIAALAEALSIDPLLLLGIERNVEPPNPLIEELTEKASHLSDEQLKQVIAIVDTFKAQKKGP